MITNSNSHLTTNIQIKIIKNIHDSTYVTNEYQIFI